MLGPSYLQEGVLHLMLKLFELDERVGIEMNQSTGVDGRMERTFT